MCATPSSHIRAFGPGVRAFGAAIVLVALFASHSYFWMPPYEAHLVHEARLAGNSPALVRFQFGWNLPLGVRVVRSSRRGGLASSS